MSLTSRVSELEMFPATTNCASPSLSRAPGAVVQVAVFHKTVYAKLQAAKCATFLATRRAVNCLMTRSPTKSTDRGLGTCVRTVSLSLAPGAGDRDGCAAGEGLLPPVPWLNAAIPQPGPERRYRCRVSKQWNRLRWSLPCEGEARTDCCLRALAAQGCCGLLGCRGSPRGHWER